MRFRGNIASRLHLRIDDYIIKPSNADALVALLAEKLLAPRIQNVDS